MGTRLAILTLTGLIAALTVGVIATGCAKERASPNTARDIDTGILVNVTTGYDDLHAVSMGLSLANSAAKRGMPVVVFLNVAAPVFASTELPADTRYEDFPPVQELLSAILAAGGKVLVCGHCAKAAGVDPTTLLPGVVVSEHGLLLDELEPGLVGFSY